MTSDGIRPNDIYLSYKGFKNIKKFFGGKMEVNAEQNAETTVTLTEENQAAEAAKQAEVESQKENLKLQMEDLLNQYGKLELSELDRSTPLVKGFRNKLTILPVALLQNKMEALAESTQENLNRLQRSQAEQMQMVFEYIAKLQEANNTLSTTVQALAQISNVTVEQIEAKVKEIEAVAAAEAEAKQDAQNNRKVVARASQSGDTVQIAFVGKIDDKEFTGGKSDNFNLKLGSNSFIPGFEDQLIGKSAGDVVEVAVSFPETYSNKNLAGKAATFTTTVKAVKETIKAEETKS